MREISMRVLIKECFDDGNKICKKKKKKKIINKTGIKY